GEGRSAASRGPQDPPRKEPDEWTTFSNLSMLGEVLVGQKKVAAAEPNLLRGYDGLKNRQVKLPPGGTIRICQAAQRLGKRYEAWGKPEDAASWRKVVKELELRDGKK